MVDVEWVKVSGLDARLTVEDLVAHFQSARCGSGCVLDVVYIGNYRTIALLEVAELDENGKRKLYKGQHSIRNCKVKVSIGTPPSESQRSAGTKFSVAQTSKTFPLRQDPEHCMPPLQDDNEDCSTPFSSPSTTHLPCHSPPMEQTIPAGSFGTQETVCTDSPTSRFPGSPPATTHALFANQPMRQAEYSQTGDISTSTPHNSPQASGKPEPQSPSAFSSSNTLDASKKCETPPLSKAPVSTAQKSPVVKVIGIAPKWKDPALYLTMAFDDDNKGGGDIAEDGISIKGNTAFITFVDPEVAERVSHQKWKVMGVNLQVSLFESETDLVQKLLKGCSPDNTIILNGIPPESEVDDQYLNLYLERTTKLEEGDHFTVSRHGTQALMTITDGSSIEEVIDKIQRPKKPLKSARLTAAKIEPIQGVHIMNMDDGKCDEDFLELYFSNEKRSGGGSVQEVRLIGRGEAIITFEKPEVFKNVLLKTHMATLGDNTTLQAYHPVLTNWITQSKTTEVRRQATNHAPLQHRMTPLLYDYFKESRDRLDPLNDKLRDECALAKLDSANKNLLVEPQDGSEWNEEWPMKCEQTVSSFLSTFHEDDVKIPSEVAGKVFPVIMQHTKNPNVSITLSDDQKHVCLVGIKDTVQLLKTTVERIVQDNLDDMQEVELPLNVLVFLNEVVKEDLQQEHQQVIFTVNLQTSTLHVSGKSVTCKAFLETVNRLHPFYVKAELPLPIVGLLSKPSGRQMLYSQIRSQKGVSHYFTDDQGGIPDLAAPATALYVVGKSQNPAMKVAKALQNTLVVENITVPGEFRHTVRMESWTKKHSEIEKNYVAAVNPLLDHSELQIVCEKKYFPEIKKGLLAFMQSECFAEASISLERGQWEYLYKYSDSWRELSKKIETSSLEYRYPDSHHSPTIFLKGEATPVKKLGAAVRSLRDDIIKDKKEVVRPGAVKHFLSPAGKLQIKGIGAELEAVVEVSTLEEQEEEKAAIEQELDTAPYQKVLSGTTQGGKQVDILTGDLTELAVDVIVNAANKRLNHGSGIAGAIVRKGGKVIQDDCTQYVERHGELEVGDAVIMTNPGNLRCKAVVHAVGPIWHDEKEKSEGYIIKAVFESIKQAASKRFRSIGFPAISTGIYCVPVDICAKAMFRGVEKFFREDPNSDMKVTIMLFQKEHIRVFADAANHHLQNVILSELKSRKTHTSQKKLPKKPSGGPQKVKTTTHTTLNRPRLPTKNVSPAIVLKKGKLTDCKVDVYVNTANNNLNLNNGAVAQSLLKAGGKGLQSECTQYVQKNGNVDYWGFATTLAGKLPCQYIIHTVCAQYGPSADKSMKDMILKVMEECDRLKVSSVAFPAIGTGNLGFPSDVVAKVMVNTISQYMLNNKNTSIKKVLLVVFMDHMHKEFEKEMQPAPLPSPSDWVSVDEHTEPDSVSSSRSPIQSSILHSFKSGSLTIDIIHGDITNDDSEGVVNSTSEDLTLMNFGVQRAFLMKGGQELQNECKGVVAQEGKLNSGKVLVTGPGRPGGLKCKKVLHVLAPRKPIELTQTVEGILHKAEHAGLHSVALPAIGTGQHGFSAKEAARYICEAIVAFSKASDAEALFLKHVKIVLYEKELFESFSSAFEENGKERGVLRWIASTVGSAVSSVSGYIRSMASQKTPYVPQTTPYVSFSGLGDGSQSHDNMTGGLRIDYLGTPAQSLTFSETTVLVIVVFASSRPVVDKIMKQVQMLIDQNFIPDEVNSERVDDLSNAAVQELQDIAVSVHVKITIDKAPLNTIKMKGDRADVQLVKNAVLKAIHRLELQEKRDKEAKMLMAKIRWQWKDEQGQFQDYDPTNNIKIEEAYSERKQQIVIDVFTEDEKKRFKVDLQAMKEEGVVPPFTVTDIKRRDLEQEREDLEKEKKEGERPKTWDPMPQNNTECYVVDLDPGSAEYKEVEQEFSKSMVPPGQFIGGCISPYGGIVKIQRIQNPGLYGQYASRKRAMDNSNPKGHQNEQRLFHGCAADTVDKINHQGFNRSFAGKNAVALGRGVYFATTAQYSSSDTYAAPDGSGNKHMYYARVLTGEYTQGAKGMIVPPPKDPTKPSVLYDSVTSGGIFVIFSDAQIYPDYLITFK